jgi:phenylacetate-CoA ligase
MMSRHVAEIHRFDPVHIFGYPSSIARLVKHAQAAGEPVRNRSLRAVFVTGELLDRSDRAVIEEAFGVPVADGYGSREGGFIAHQCPRGVYHVTMESLIVELLDASGRPVETGQTGEIVLTHLDTVGMPFIRYQTGDLARKSAKPCECGRALESLEMIEGRRTDMLRTADGGYAHALSVIYVLRDEPTVARFRVVQQADRSLDVQLVTRDGFGLAECQSIERLLKRRLGQSIAVRISQVDEIPSEPSGKHRHVLSAAP